MATIQGRGQIQNIELAATAEGKITGVRVKLLADMGGYLQLITPGIPLLGGFIYGGVYDIPTFGFTCTGVFTTKTPTDAYRGAGRPEATYAIERAINALAYEMDLDPAEIRRRNFIQPDQFPYSAAAGLVYDSGNYEPALDKALEHAGYDELRAEQQRRRDAGDTKLLGIGISSYFEMCGLAPSRALGGLGFGAGGWEAATVRIQPTGKVQVVTGTTPHGQGHETSWSMIVADKLGISPDDVDVLHSDTAVSPFGLDTYGSRSLAVGGTAVYNATDRVVDKAAKLAAHLMEVAEEDLQLRGGSFEVKGSPDRTMALAEVAFAAFTAHNLPEGMEPNLEGISHWDPPNFTFPFGTHICIVEVDTETGFGGHREVRRGRRLRQPGQPPHRRGPAPRRDRPGRRPGPPRRGRVRRRRQPAHGHADGLHGPVGHRVPQLHAGPHRHPQPHQPDGRQGGRGGRHHRRRPGGHERHHRRPPTARHHPPRDARVARSGCGTPFRPPMAPRPAQARKGVRHDPVRIRLPEADIARPGPPGSRRQR